MTSQLAGLEICYVSCMVEITLFEHHYWKSLKLSKFIHPQVQWFHDSQLQRWLHWKLKIFCFTMCLHSSKFTIKLLIQPLISHLLCWITSESHANANIISHMLGHSHPFYYGATTSICGGLACFVWLRCIATVVIRLYLTPYCSQMFTIFVVHQQLE